MDWQAWLTLATCVGVLGALALTNIGADLVMLAAVALLLSAGVLDAKSAFMGFANEGVITVGVLFVVAAGIRETGALNTVVSRILGRPKTVMAAQVRMALPVAGLSAFMNNTPLVAMMLPVVTDWAKQLRISPSRLLMPLSFAAILGGVCTLLGTSTNLVVNGLLIDHQRAHGLQATGLRMFDIAWIGVPCAIIGLIYVIVANRWLLKDRTPPISLEGDPREYTVEMMVEEGSSLVGRSIEEAGLRQLPGMYLMEIERGGEIIPMVGPHQRLHGNDRLVFVGIVDSILELQRIRGLRPATDQVFKLNSPRGRRCLIEAVVSNSCRLIGQTIRDGRFRSVYNAAVIAVARNGKRLRQKIGDIELEPGDTLLLEADPSFADLHRNSRDFYLVSRVDDSTPPKHERAWIALAILIGMILTAATGMLSMLNAALLAGGLMVATRCISGPLARRSVDWQVLLVIGAALGLGRAMSDTGAAAAVARFALQWVGDHPLLALIAVYALTTAFTEVLSNNAAAALMFPVTMATAEALEVSPMPFLMAVMIAASCAFATPIGYQTNLMVYGPGGYRFVDFVRFGAPLNILIGAVTVVLAPVVWPF